MFRIFARRLTTPSTAPSYVHGVSADPLRGETIGQILRQQNEKLSDREIFVCSADGTRRTYGQFLSDCEKLASGLVALGLKPGERVGMWAPNCMEWVQTQFATALAGFVLVNINPAYQSRELEYALRKVGVKALISSHSFKSQNYYDMLFDICPELANSKPGNLVSSKLPELKHLAIISDENHDGAWKYSDLLEAGDSASHRQFLDFEKRVDIDHACNIQFTSGTTGNPKGATLSHHNIVNNAYFVGKRVGFEKMTARICCPPPLYHCMGCVFGSLCAVVYGGTCFFPSRGFQPLAAMETISREKCNAVYGTPTMYIDMLNHDKFNEFDFSALRTGIMAGSPCPQEVCRQVMERMNMREFTVVYGTTENSPATFQTLSNDSEERRISTVGRVHDHQEAKIVDHDGNMTPVGVPGELLIRGYCVFLGYWADEEKTREVLSQDRWYHTGDLAVLDKHGYCRIVGRIKDMIVRGGENVYPTEIESVLFTHPAIQDVHIIGVPDARLGEEICAWIRTHHGENATAEELKTFCKGKLAHFKIPKYFVFKNEEDFLPLTTVTGKIQKYKMREISKKELGLDHVISHMSTM